MNISTLTDGEPWMTLQEREINHQLIRAIAQSLAEAGVRETTLLTLRVNDVAATWLLARRLESALTPAEGAPPPCPTPAQAGAIGKCRDRLRRAMKELEACCPRDAAPVRQCLDPIDHMHEAVRMVPASGILDEPTNTVNDDSPDSDRRSQRHDHQAPPNTSHTTHNPNPTGPAAPPPPNRATRRLQAREERRNRTGRYPMGTYRRTTPQVEQHPRTASTHHEKNGSGTQRGGISRPG